MNYLNQYIREDFETLEERVAKDTYLQFFKSLLRSRFRIKEFSNEANYKFFKLAYEVGTCAVYMPPSVNIFKDFKPSDKYDSLIVFKYQPNDDQNNITKNGLPLYIKADPDEVKHSNGLLPSEPLKIGKDVVIYWTHNTNIITDLDRARYYINKLYIADKCLNNNIMALNTPFFISGRVKGMQQNAVKAEAYRKILRDIKKIKENMPFFADNRVIESLNVLNTGVDSSNLATVQSYRNQVYDSALAAFGFSNLGRGETQNKERLITSEVKIESDITTEAAGDYLHNLEEFARRFQDCFGLVLTPLISVNGSYVDPNTWHKYNKIKGSGGDSPENVESMAGVLLADKNDTGAFDYFGRSSSGVEGVEPTDYGPDLPDDYGGINYRLNLLLGSELNLLENAKNFVNDVHDARDYWRYFNTVRNFLHYANTVNPEAFESFGVQIDHSSPQNFQRLLISIFKTKFKPVLMPTNQVPEDVPLSSQVPETLQSESAAVSGAGLTDPTKKEGENTQKKAYSYYIYLLASYLKAGYALTLPTVLSLSLLASLYFGGYNVDFFDVAFTTQIEDWRSKLVVPEFQSEIKKDIYRSFRSEGILGVIVSTLTGLGLYGVGAAAGIMPTPKEIWKAYKKLQADFMRETRAVARKTKDVDLYRLEIFLGKLTIILQDFFVIFLALFLTTGVTPNIVWKDIASLTNIGFTKILKDTPLVPWLSKYVGNFIVIYMFRQLVFKFSYDLNKKFFNYLDDNPENYAVKDFSSIFNAASLSGFLASPNSMPLAISYGLTTAMAVHFDLLLYYANKLITHPEEKPNAFLQLLNKWGHTLAGRIGIDYVNNKIITMIITKVYAAIIDPTEGLPKKAAKYFAKGMGKVVGTVYEIFANAMGGVMRKIGEKNKALYNRVMPEDLKKYFDDHFTFALDNLYNMATIFVDNLKKIYEKQVKPLDNDQINDITNILNDFESVEEFEESSYESAEESKVDKESREKLEKLERVVGKSNTKLAINAMTTISVYSSVASASAKGIVAPLTSVGNALIESYKGAKKANNENAGKLGVIVAGAKGLGRGFVAPFKSIGSDILSAKAGIEKAKEWNKAIDIKRTEDEINKKKDEINKKTLQKVDTFLSGVIEGKPADEVAQNVINEDIKEIEKEQKKEEPIIEDIIERVDEVKEGLEEVEKNTELNFKRLALSKSVPDPFDVANILFSHYTSTQVLNRKLLELFGGNADNPELMNAVHYPEYIGDYDLTNVDELQAYLETLNYYVPIIILKQALREFNTLIEDFKKQKGGK